MVCATSKGLDQPAHTRSLIRAEREYFMTVKLLTDFLSLKGGCTGLAESTLVKIPHCWKSHVTTHIRPLAGYGLPPPPPRGNFVDHIILEAQCLARILQHVSPLTMAGLSCNSLLHTLPYKIFYNYNSF